MKIFLVLFIVANLFAFLDLVVIQGQLKALRADLRVLLNHEGLLKDTENQL